LPADANNPGEQAAPPDLVHLITGGNHVPVPVVPNAHLLARIGQTDMRVGVTTNDFGLIEVCATVTQDRVGTSIATAHAALHSAMMLEVPSLQQSLERHHLRLDAFNVSTSTGGHGGSSFEQHTRSPSSQQADPRSFRFPDSVRTSAGAESASNTTYSSRLSVLA
jgi:hypothetical protein